MPGDAPVWAGAVSGTRAVCGDRVHEGGGSAARLAVVLAGVNPAGVVPHLAP